MQATSHTVRSDWYCIYSALCGQSAGRESTNMHGEIGYTECYCARAQFTHITWFTRRQNNSILPTFGLHCFHEYLFADGNRRLRNIPSFAAVERNV